MISYTCIRFKSCQIHCTVDFSSTIPYFSVSGRAALQNDVQTISERKKDEFFRDYSKICHRLLSTLPAKNAKKTTSDPLVPVHLYSVQKYKMQRSSQDVGPAMMGSGPPLRNSNFNNMPPLSVKVQGSDPPPRTMMLPKLPRFPSPPLDSGDISLVLEPDPLRHAELAIEEYVKSELDLRLDTDAQICRANLSPQGCPNGPSCPFRHTKPSHKNFRPPSPKPYSAAAHTVCKHWLRGLCKKGKACEFMHEYNLKKMPECYYFSTTGFCQSGDECMFLHNRPFDKRPDCINFIRGFCPNGTSKVVRL